MRASLIAFTVCLVSLSVHAQTVWTIAETTVYERPDVSSPILVRIPTGTTLTLVADQQEWIAISTPDGRAGWIGRSYVSFTRPADTPQPPAQRQPPPPAQDQVPPPPPSRSEPVPRYDPPPGGQDYGRAYRPPLDSKGFYNSKYWMGLGVGNWSESLDEGGQDLKIRYILPELSLGMMFGRYVALNLIGIGSVIDASGDGVGSDALYSAGGGLALLGFPLSPTRNLPIGVYLEVRGTADQRFNSDFEEQGGILSLGGGGGVFAHLGDKMLFIPKLTFRYLDLGFYSAGDKIGDDSSTSVTLSVEGKFGALIPGLFVTFVEGEQIFGGSVTLAL